MNYQEFFIKAKENEIEESELSFGKSKSLSFTIYNGDLENYTFSNNSSLSARGKYHGKAGYVNTEKLDSSTIPFLIEKIKENAEVNNSSDELIIFKGSEKYHNKKVYSKKLDETPADEKIAILKKLYEVILSQDKRITDVELSYQEDLSEYILMNSYGLNLKSKSNCFVIYAEVIARQGEETKTDGKVYVGQDLSQFDIDTFAKDAVKKTVSQFNSIICDSKKYRAILSSDVASSFLNFYLGHIIADEVQKNTSHFKGKLNEKIASSKVTVEERPLDKGPSFRSFDDEGVATSNKVLIDKGVLKTYLYNLATAKKDNTVSTGNGYRSSGKVSTALTNARLKPSKLSESDLISKVKEGIYISDVEGLHAGMNGQSGNFSLQARGYLIKDGKLSTPVSLITVAGNLFTIFQDVMMVANNIENYRSVNSPSLLIKSIAVSGK